MGFKCESLKIENCKFFPEIAIFGPTIYSTYWCWLHSINAIIKNAISSKTQKTQSLNYTFKTCPTVVSEKYSIHVCTEHNYTCTCTCTCTHYQSPTVLKFFYQQKSTENRLEKEGE